MAVPKGVHNNMAKHVAHNDDPGGEDYLGFGFQSLKVLNPPSVPI